MDRFRTFLFWVTELILASDNELHKSSVSAEYSHHISELANIAVMESFALLLTQLLSGNLLLAVNPKKPYEVFSDLLVIS